MRIDHAAWPFVAAAALPSLLLVWTAPWVALLLCALPLGIAMFFRDPDRQIASGPRVVVAPADGRVMFAGDAKPDEAPAGRWRQVTIFLSLLDVHINRMPLGGRVTRVERVAGRHMAAYRPDAHRNAHTEVWVDHHGTSLVFRQVVGVLARRIVCRVSTGDEVATGARIGLMKFGSRMDVFLPAAASLRVQAGDRVRAGETAIAEIEDTTP